MSSTFSILVSDGDRSLEKYLEEIRNCEPLSSGEERDIATSIRNGDTKARNRLVLANLRFVVNVAMHYQNQGISLADLINEGNVGLITAAERFDGNKGFKFISYAVWWVRQAILGALAEQTRIVRMPLNKVGLLSKIFNTSSLLQQEMNGKVDIGEIAQELNIPEKQIEDVLTSALRAYSLDASLGGDDERILMDVLEDEAQELPDALLMGNCLAQDLAEVLDTLEEREAEIIRLYFGLGDIEPLTLDQIGELYGLTRERVRQIKERALNRLRHPVRSKNLRPYVES